MKNGFRQSMAWLHTWTGLTLGWILFAIFATGTSAYFKEEISQWMTPEAQVKPVSNQQAALGALNSMQQRAATAKTWYITLPNERQSTTVAYWNGADGFENATLDPSTGQEVAARDTRGGNFFYRFHFELFGFPVLIGRIIVGIAAMLMFIALVSGVITHKKIISDFFTFRPKKGQRSWLDFHNVTSVLSLPFFMMITYTGLVVFFYIYMPWGMMAGYGEQRDKFFDEVSQSVSMPEATGKPAAMLGFDQLLARAQPALAGRSISRIEMSAPNDESATLKITPATRDQLNIYNQPIQVNAITGQVTTQDAAQSGMIVAAGTVYGLHIAHVANWPMRWLLFTSGILGCCMVGSGMVLWTVKRRMQQLKTNRFHVGHYLVERLNISVIIGLPTAMAGFFLANRLLDVKLEDRSALEVKAFFIVWGLLLLHALLRPWAKAWKEQLMLAGLAFAAVPSINLIVTPDAALINTLKDGNWVLASFDLTMLAFAAVFWIMLGYLIRHQDKVVAKMQQKIEKRQLAKALAKQQAELQNTELQKNELLQAEKEG